MSSPHPTPTPDLKKYLRSYFLLFAIQLVGIVMVVGAYYLHQTAIAVVLATLVLLGTIAGGILIHKALEKKTVPALLIFTAFFVLCLIVLTIVAFSDHPVATVIRK